MQLNILNKNLKPLTIIAGTMYLTSINYGDIDSYTNLQNKIFSDSKNEYQINEDSSKYNYNNELRFKAHLNKWKEETMFSSSANNIINNINFKAIVSMGEAAVPYIIYEISKSPSTLVWALNLIFEKKISNNPRITISEACKLWTKKLSK